MLATVRLSRKEELELRRQSFAQLRRGSLFTLGRLQYFIAVGQIAQGEWSVIELTAENKGRIVGGQHCVSTILRFADMTSLDILDGERYAKILAKLKR